MGEHHRRMIRYSVDHMAFLEGQIGQLDQEIAARIREAIWNRNGDCAKPTWSCRRPALPDMTQFPLEKHISSWAGICPGNNRSARAVAIVEPRSAARATRRIAALGWQRRRFASRCRGADAGFTVLLRCRARRAARPRRRRVRRRHRRLEANVLVNRVDPGGFRVQQRAGLRCRPRTYFSEGRRHGSAARAAPFGHCGGLLKLTLLGDVCSASPRARPESFMFHVRAQVKRRFGENEKPWQKATGYRMARKTAARRLEK